MFFFKYLGSEFFTKYVEIVNFWYVTLHYFNTEMYFILWRNLPAIFYYYRAGSECF